VLEKVLLLLQLAGTGQVGVGTIFGSSNWDAHNPHSNLACTHREIDDSKDMVVAHNTLPCHSKVWVFNPRTGRSVMARVADRGPRHALIDMSKGVARRLKHNGMEKVLVVPIPDRPLVGTAAALQQIVTLARNR
jgi:rare lipoprotein A (peptidoglycan hydrolase)